MIFDYRFVKAGSKAPEKMVKGEIWIDVGSADCTDERKVFDHHHNSELSAFSVLLRHINSGDALVDISREKSLTIVTHKAPDIDALFSIWLLKKYIELGKSGFFETYDKNVIESIRSYVDGIDSGKSKKICLETRFASLYVYICFIDEVTKWSIEDSKKEGKEKWQNLYFETKRVEMGLELVQFAVDKMNEDKEFSLPDNSLGYKYDDAIKKLLEEDTPKYKRDAENKNLIFSAVNVPYKNETEDRTVNAAIWKGQTDCEFAYLYARQGMVLEGQEPCTLTAVPEYDKQTGKLSHFRISLDLSVCGNDCLTLKPLAVALEYMEQIEEAIELRGESRTHRNYGESRGGGVFAEYPFCEVSDPWYISDDESMIDIPRCGTKLSEKDIIKVIHNNASIIKKNKIVKFESVIDRTGHMIVNPVCINDKKTNNLQTWVDCCKREIGELNEGEHLFVFAEMNAAIIPYNNYLMKQLCLNIAGFGIDKFDTENILFTDRNTCIYSTDKFTIVIAATRTTDNNETVLSEYKKAIFELVGYEKIESANGESESSNEKIESANEKTESANEKTDGALGTVKYVLEDKGICTSALSRMISELVLSKNELTYFGRKVKDISGRGRWAVIRENEKFLDLLTRILSSDIRKDVLEQNIYNYCKEQMKIVTLSESVETCLNSVVTNSNERTSRFFTVLSRIAIPFLIACNLFQTGFLDFDAFFGTHRSQGEEFPKYLLDHDFAWKVTLEICVCTVIFCLLVPVFINSIKWIIKGIKNKKQKDPKTR